MSSLGINRYLDHSTNDPRGVGRVSPLPDVLREMRLRRRGRTRPDARPWDRGLISTDALLRFVYFEEVQIGDTFVSRPREISQEDVERFAELTGDRNPIHLDPEYAAHSPFGHRIAHGLLSLSLALGLWSAAGITRGSLVALVAIEDARFLFPVSPGDSVHLSCVLKEKRELSSKPDSGLVLYEHELLNGENQVVLRFRVTVLLKRRQPPPSA